jgi:hypothetical protein
LDAVQQFLCATTDRLRLEDFEVVGWEIQRPSYRVLGKGSSSCHDQGQTTGTLYIATVGHQWRRHDTFLQTISEGFDEVFKLEELNAGPNCTKHNITFEVFFQSQVTTSSCMTIINKLNLKNQDYNYNIKKKPRDK